MKRQICFLRGILVLLVALLCHSCQFSEDRYLKRLVELNPPPADRWSLAVSRA